MTTRTATRTANPLPTPDGARPKKFTTTPFPTWNESARVGRMTDRDHLEFRFNVWEISLHMKHDGGRFFLIYGPNVVTSEDYQTFPLPDGIGVSEAKSRAVRELKRVVRLYAARVVANLDTV